MDTTQLFETSAQAVIDDGMLPWEGQFRQMTAADRATASRTLKRITALHAAMLVNPGDQAAREELKSLHNTFTAMVARYQINGALMLRQFVLNVVDRVSGRLLNYGFGFLEKLD